MEENQKPKVELTDLGIIGIPYEEKKRFRALCGKEDKPSPAMLIALMDRFEGKE